MRSKSYEYRVAPVEDSPEMVVLRPGDPQLTLSPGRYALVLAGRDMISRFRAKSRTLPNVSNEPMLWVETCILSAEHCLSICQIRGATRRIGLEGSSV